MTESFASRHFAALVLFGLAAAVWGVAEGAARGRPTRTSDSCIAIAGPARIDVGPLDRDAPKTITLKLVNRCGEEVPIERVWTSCGCTIASAVVSRVAAGGAAEISLKLDTSQPGRKESRVFIQTRIGGIQEVGRIAFSVRPGWTATANPWRITLLPGRDAAPPVPLILRADETYDPARVSLRCLCPGLSFRLRHGTRRLEVHLEPDMAHLPAGRFRVPVILASDIRNAPTTMLELEFQNLIRRVETEPTPAVARVGAGELQTTAAVTLRVDAKEARLLRASSMMEGVRVDVVDREEGGAGGLRVSFEHPVEASVRVPVCVETDQGIVGFDLFVGATPK